MARAYFQSATATPAVNAGSATDEINVLTAHRLGGVVGTIATVIPAIGGAVLAAREVLASGLSHQTNWSLSPPLGP